ncbi:LysR family transcriptional regulator [Alcaligenaceae bacterium CGII-47]|nr:LysR family transcriptional regulator [Alcaligenaceae bacterium CGII-47]
MGKARTSDLIDLCLVVQYGGISAAARAVNRPKSSLSLAIRRLEDDLAVRLMDRSKHNFQLTERGLSLHESIGPLLAQLDHITSDFSASSGQARGSLRIAAPYEFGAHHLAPIVKNLVARNPQIVVSLDVQYAPVRELFGSGYDVAFVMANGDLSDPGLVSCRVFMLKRALFAAPGFLDKYPNLHTPSDLLGVPLIASPQEAQWQFTGPERQAINIPIPNSHFMSSNADVRRQAALDGLGVIRVVASFCDEAVRSNQLRRVLPDFACAPLRVYAVIDERRLMPATVKALFDELELTAPDLFIEEHHLHC